MNVTGTLREKLLGFQKNEITEHHIYSKLAEKVKSPVNRRILEDIADDELLISFKLSR
jgi:vacuolar iron transporter family protein